jgi:glycosidase
VGLQEDKMKHPSMYQINTRVVLQERGMALGRAATLDDIPDGHLDDLAAKGFEWVWLLGVWQTGQAARDISRSNAHLREAYRQGLPDLRDEDITGSPFAIVAYEAHKDFGGAAALRRIRERLARRKLKLLLDFVPNHTAPDHPWVKEHPEYYVHGTEEDLARAPQNYARVTTGRGQEILAYGRDPYFDGWPDTFQLNYRHAGFREAQLAQLGAVATRCDGVRCDMAMLVQPQIFQRTWGDRALPTDGSPPRDVPFWPEAISSVRRRHPEFLFVAEVYWDMEYELQRAGFDYTYDKRLYDRLVSRQATAVREHLMADQSFQDHSLRFLENHDEPRAAATFSPAQHRAAAALTFTARGLRFFHEGELEGRKIQISMHLGRRPQEPVDEELRAFYDRLLAVLRRPTIHHGFWRQWPARPAWDGNASHQQFIVSSWYANESPSDRTLLSVVNYADRPGQCYVALDLPGLGGRRFDLVDLLSDTRYQRTGDDLLRGLYFDLPAWGQHVFELQPV